MAVDLGTAYISLVPSTKDFDKGIKSAFDGTVKHAETAGNTMGVKLAAGIVTNMGRAGGQSGDAFGKTFTPKVQGAGKLAMQGLGSAMLGGASGIGSQVGGGIAGGLVNAVSRGADTAAAILGKLGSNGTWSSGIVTAGTVAAGGVALVTAAAAAATKELYTIGETWDAVADGITFKTGLVGDRLGELKQSVKDVASDTAASIGDIADVAAALTKGFKLPPGSGLEQLTQQISAYNAAAKENGGEPVNMREFIKAMKQMKFDTDGVEGMSKQFDELYKVTQNTTLPMNDLIRNLKLFGPIAETLKLPATTVVQFISGMEESGLNAEQAMFGLRKALGSLKDDPDPAGGFRNKIAEISTLLQSASEDAQTAGEKMAVEFFGNRAGPALAQAIKNGEVELDNFNDKASTTGLTIRDMVKNTEDFSQEWQKFKNLVSVNLEPIATKVFGGINDMLTALTGNLRADIDLLKEFFNTASGGNVATPNLPPWAAPMGPAAPAILGGAAGTGPGAGINAGGGGNAASSILGGMAGASAGVPTLGGAVIGTAGRGYFNSRAAAAALDRRLLDSALLSQVPSGRYSQTGPADLTQGLADCSSAVEDLVNILDGRSTAGRSMSTGNAAAWLMSRGFQPGSAPGAFNVGFNDAHMQATLPGGTNFNWGSDYMAGKGGVGGTGAFDPTFTQHFFRYDEGGVLPPGMTMVQNATGKPEMVLNPDQQQQLADALDPNTVIHGSAQGAPPGPQSGTTSDQPDYGMDFIRSLGFVPATAGSTSKAGTSSLARIIDMGASVVGGVLDTGASLANTAISAAIMAGAGGASMGPGAAAAPIGSMAAGYGIQLASNLGKTIANYWFGLGGILADAAIEQTHPFGTPRWLGYDYTQFVPQTGLMQAGLGTLEKMGNNEITKAINNALNPQANNPMGAAAPGTPAAAMGGPGGPVNPSTMPGASQPLPEPPNPNSPIQPPDVTSGPGPTSQTVPVDPMAAILGYDQGGILPPGGFAVNMTDRPEPVLTPQQWEAITAGSSAPAGRAPLVNNLYASDMQDAIRQLQKVQRRDMMQYSGRA